MAQHPHENDVNVNRHKYDILIGAAASSATH